MAWRFYGRHEEIRRLHDFMDGPPGFDALALRGRRQVGKTDLIDHYFAQERPEERRPVVVFHLGSTADPAGFPGAFADAVRAVAPGLLEGFRPAVEADPLSNFPLLAAHVLRQGAVVAIDEFQRIAGKGDLESDFQKVIDGTRRGRRASGLSPRLIVMGSAQQQLVEMFKSKTSPLWNRVTEFLHLRPWGMADLAEVAADRGWDARPDRLLTMWTAYGGMPAHWERFSRSPQADFSRNVDDNAWTDAFLEAEEAYRRTDGGDFAAQMEVQLRPLDRKVVAWLAEKPGGQRLDELPGELRAPLAAEALREGLAQGDDEVVLAQAALRNLLETRLSGQHLDLVARREALDEPGIERWHVTDEHARFQLDVLEKTEEMAGQLHIQARARVAALRRERMQRAEGPGLESLAEASVKQLLAFGAPGFAEPGALDRSDVFPGAWRRAPQAEIDLLALEHEEVQDARTVGPGTLWGVFSKRTATEHAPVRDGRHVANWLSRAGNTAVERYLAPFRAWERCLVSVAPVWTQAAEAGLVDKVLAARQSDPAAGEVDSWHVMDIPDMLAGRGPRTLQPPPPPPPGEGKDDWTPPQP